MSLKRSDNSENVEIEDEYTVWEGEWISSVQDQVRGKIYIPLKENFVEKYSTRVAINYTGPFKTDQIDSFMVTVSKSDIDRLNSNEVTYLEFSGNIGYQVIEYSIAEYNPNRIIGIYKSYNPEDFGDIELRPSSIRSINYGVSKSGWCAIF